jgi:integrase/recombinase XerD
MGRGWRRVGIRAGRSLTGCGNSTCSAGGEFHGALSSGELTPERVESFLAARRAAGYSTWSSVRSTALPLEYLRELGVVPVTPVGAVVDDPLERLLADFARYLLAERGLTEHTVFARYVPAARLFLTSRAGLDVSGLKRLTGADVSLFMAAECPKRSVSAARDLMGGLRSLLRYLYLTGTIPNPLVWAVPAIADLRDSSLPRGLEPSVVKRLLASCDRRRTVGRRDYAIYVASRTMLRVVGSRRLSGGIAMVQAT